MDDTWSPHDALMYRALSLFPEKLEGEFLDVNDFRNHFTDFYGRPVQDIAEALYLYGSKGYFEAGIMLTANYLKQGNALAQVAAALNHLRPGSDVTPDEHRGLSSATYAKVVRGSTLTISEVRNLPDDARPYLVFKLSNLDRRRLREELAIYNDNAFIQPSRLEKHNNIGRLGPKPLFDGPTSITIRSYDVNTGTLFFGGQKILIIRQQSKRGKAVTETAQGRIMRMLFKDVNTIRNGVFLHPLISVSKPKFDAHKRKKVVNHIAEINHKIEVETGVPKLIIYDRAKCYIDKSYLYNV